MHHVLPASGGCGWHSVTIHVSVLRNPKYSGIKQWFWLIAVLIE
jgi:hypothetical protein